MARRVSRRLLGAMLLSTLFYTGTSKAQEPEPAAEPVWVAGESAAPGWITVETAPRRRAFGLGRLFARPAPTAEGSPNVGLPRGRRYYNGRFFGELSNRYYGPQYGYF